MRNCTPSEVREVAQALLKLGYGYGAISRISLSVLASDASTEPVEREEPIRVVVRMAEQYFGIYDFHRHTFID